MMDNFEPRRGAFAFCSQGDLGLILSKTVVLVEYDHGTNGQIGGSAFAWTGIHLSPGKFGQPWSSRTPRVVGELRIAHTRTMHSNGDPEEAKTFFVVDGRRQSRAILEL